MQGSSADNTTPLEQLVWFCSLSHKSQMADAMVCGGNLQNAQPACVAGKCLSCGFRRLWEPVRRTVVDAYGKLREGSLPVWQHKIRYEVLRSGSSSSPSDGSPQSEKESLRERKEATVVEFFDAFQKASVAFPAHRPLVRAAKAAALQRDRNFWPGMLLSDYDWSENGKRTESSPLLAKFKASTGRLCTTLYSSRSRRT